MLPTTSLFSNKFPPVVISGRNLGWGSDRHGAMLQTLLEMQHALHDAALLDQFRLEKDLQRIVRVCSCPTEESFLALSDTAVHRPLAYRFHLAVKNVKRSLVILGGSQGHHTSSCT